MRSNKYRDTASKTVLHNTGATNLEVVDDVARAGQKVIKLVFNSDAEAASFAAACGTKSKGSDVFVGPDRCKRYFQEKHGITVFGRNDPHPLFDCVVHECRPRAHQQYVPSQPISRAGVGVIGFYDKNQPYYEFTNVAATPFKIIIGAAENVAVSSECLYQAMKGVQSNGVLSREALAVLNAKEPNQQRAGQTLAGTNMTIFHGPTSIPVPGSVRRFCDADYSVKEESMRQILLCKFSQNPPLLGMLLGTGDALLVENAGAKDPFWGNGADGKGRNALGKVLMAVRDDFQNETRANGHVAVRNSFTPELCGILGLAQTRGHKALPAETEVKQPDTRLSNVNGGRLAPGKEKAKGGCCIVL